MNKSIIKLYAEGNTIESYEYGTVRCIECGTTSSLMSVESGAEDETGCDHQTFLVCQPCYDDQDRPYECTPLAVKRPIGWE